MNTRISIDNLIAIVKSGGRVKTGIDVYTDKGVLLLARDIVVEKIRVLEIIKAKGIKSIWVNTALNGGLWNSDGHLIKVSSDGIVDYSNPCAKQAFGDTSAKQIENRLREIEEIRQQANLKYTKAKLSVKKVLSDIKNTGGQFDYEAVESSVCELVDFLSAGDNPFSYLTHEIFSHDDYLYNHCVNVCAIGTAVVNRFNKTFSKMVDDIYDISLGFFLHDVGKVLVPDAVLNKKSRLTQAEFDEVRKHSYEYGIQILEKNKLKNSVIKNIVHYHHAPLFEGEGHCYPQDKQQTRIPLYVKICKLADIYDAMTSRRCYEEACNPINVVTQVFRTYAKKDRMLQYILHAFVKSIGIYPPGSIVYLRNGQLAYVLESDGPILLPFTDEKENTLRHSPDPFRADPLELDNARTIDSRRSVKAPIDVNSLLPSYIRQITMKSA